MREPREASYEAFTSNGSKMWPHRVTGLGGARFALKRARSSFGGLRAPNKRH